uniref:Uncharacterized protein n=1 Tax=Anopheles quadriannulatus TaxID=34691 RepID=A0A182XR10_ANOQN
MACLTTDVFRAFRLDFINTIYIMRFLQQPKIGFASFSTSSRQYELTHLEVYTKTELSFRTTPHVRKKNTQFRSLLLKERFDSGHVFIS